MSIDLVQLSDFIRVHLCYPWTEVNTDTHNWSKGREQVHDMVCHIWGIYIKPPPLRFSDKHRRSNGKVLKAKGWERLGSNSVFWK